MTPDEKESGTIMAETTDRLAGTQRAAELLTVDMPHQSRICDHGGLRRRARRHMGDRVLQIAEVEGV